KELQERDERLQVRYEALSELAENARRSASASQQRLAELDRTISAPPDLSGMWRELVGPVVQLAGDASVGSGVLLPSHARPEGGFQTYVVTAWHVVRDIQGDPPDLTLPVPVQIYREDGTTRNEKAKLLAHEPKLDAALLEIVTTDALEYGARLAPRSRLEQARIFDQVVAVGCPLGNDPIPTRGEIATCQHEVDGERYWMINAPTYIGNSGGGIFDSKTHELMGIFSKIYTHGSLRPTIVPHMGLVTPLTKVYDWLAQTGYAALVPSETRIGEAGHTAE
ncbi:MAG: trypsin-like peptidase domain-containing protein, partial [Planctomycetes bacterium]|nr:trypsin-like peptidase domain-containing protein [Planctomycetota bacterium]